ncbi:MAG TPA: hypothetical protein VFB50_10255 [Chloroflexota bacterium]|nr:hypothetical protein [Chloroflexota bacterium]
MNGRVQTEDVEGVVEATNATGLKLGGAWLNVSRFHPVDLPETGAHVRMKIDAKGYIVALENLSAESVPTVLSHKDERITRLAVLKAAAEFVGRYAQMREDVKSEHVLVLADRWLEWVNRP